MTGWSLDNHTREELIIGALNMAIDCRDGARNMLLHSDRGAQYRGNDYQSILKNNVIQCSMGRKGNCWDNAVMESFFGRFKVELIYAEIYKSVETA